MAITSTRTKNGPLTKFSAGSYIDTGGTTAASIALGFFPVRVTVYNETNVILYDWFFGMSSGYALKVNSTGPAVSDITSGGISGAGDTTSKPSTIVTANVGDSLFTDASDAATYNKGKTSDVGTIAPGEEANPTFSFPIVQSSQYRWVAIG